MVEVLEQILVIDRIGVVVHEPDFGRGVLLWGNALLCDKSDLFEKEFIVCVRYGNFQERGAFPGAFNNCNPVFLTPFFGQVFCIHPRKIQTKFLKNHLHANFATYCLQSAVKSS